MPRFSPQRAIKPVVPEWGAMLVWKYRGNKTAEELVAKLKEQRECEGWDIELASEKLPLNAVSSKKEIAENATKVQSLVAVANLTDEQCFGKDRTNADTVEETISWYRREVLGELGGQKRKKVPAAERDL